MLYRLKIGGDGDCQYKNKWGALYPYTLQQRMKPMKPFLLPRGGWTPGIIACIARPKGALSSGVTPKIHRCLKHLRSAAGRAHCRPGDLLQAGPPSGRDWSEGFASEVCNGLEAISQELLGALHVPLQPSQQRERQPPHLPGSLKLCCFILTPKFRSPSTPVLRDRRLAVCVHVRWIAGGSIRILHTYYNYYQC